MIEKCQKPTGHGTCEGELKEHLSAEGGKFFIHTACVNCHSKPCEPFELKGQPPERLPEQQLSLELKFSF